MIAGFTGTQSTMSTDQFDRLVKLCKDYKITELHHGDCVGADAVAHDIAESLNIRTVIHPPIKPFKRAFKKGDMILPMKDYLVRNRDIVNASEILFACPKGPEELRSGTWSTVRYARRVKKPIEIVMP